MSGLPRTQSVSVGLAVMGLSWAIYNQVCPKVADLRVSQANDTHAAQAEKAARWTAGAVVTGVALITRDATVFIMGAGMVVALSWMHRHANWRDPALVRGVSPTAPNIHTGDGMPSGQMVRA